MRSEVAAVGPRNLVNARRPTARLPSQRVSDLHGVQRLFELVLAGSPPSFYRIPEGRRIALKRAARYPNWSAVPRLGVVVGFDVLRAVTARNDLDAADQNAAPDLPHSGSIEGRNDIGLAVWLQENCDLDAAAWPRVPDAVAIEQLADPTGVLDRLLGLQLYPLMPGAKDLVVADRFD